MNLINIGDPNDPIPPPSTAKLNKRRSFIKNLLNNNSDDSFEIIEYISYFNFIRNDNDYGIEV